MNNGIFQRVGWCLRPLFKNLVSLEKHVERKKSPPLKGVSLFTLQEMDSGDKCGIVATLIPCN